MQIKRGAQVSFGSDKFKKRKKEWGADGVAGKEREELDREKQKERQENIYQRKNFLKFRKSEKAAS